MRVYTTSQLIEVTLPVGRVESGGYVLTSGPGDHMMSVHFDLEGHVNRHTGLDSLQPW